MSRTKKGSKGPGHEYWSKRPTPISDPGKDAKKRTHRMERIEKKKLIKKEREDLD